MSIFGWGNRKQSDKYASAKSVGEFSLAASLVADDIKDMYVTVEKGEGVLKYFWVLIVIVGVSLFLQLVSMIFALILYFNKYPKVDDTSQTPGVEMTPPVNGDGDTPSQTASTDTLGVRFESTNDLADPIPPLHLQRMNDGLTVTTVVVVILHIIKNALRSGIIDVILPK